MAKFLTIALVLVSFYVFTLFKLREIYNFINFSQISSTSTPVNGGINGCIDKLKPIGRCWHSQIDKVVPHVSYADLSAMDSCVNKELKYVFSEFSKKSAENVSPLN